MTIDNHNEIDNFSSQFASVIIKKILDHISMSFQLTY